MSFFLDKGVIVVKEIKQPLVSVIMPVYNVEKYLEESIDSVINQTYKNFELLIIDDGSTDSSLQIAKKYSKDARINIFTIKNVGLSAARNFGIENASGDYLYFVDSDDFVEPTLLDDVINTMIIDDSEMVIFNFNSVDENSSPIKNPFVIPLMDGKYSSEEVMLSYLKGNIQNYAWSYIVKTNVFYQYIRFPKGKTYEDLAVFPHVITLINKISILDKPLYNYRKRSNSITQSKNMAKVYLADYTENIINNEKWLYGMFGGIYKKEVTSYLLNHYLHIYLSASKEFGLKYFKVIEICIIHIIKHFKEFRGSNLSIKRKLVAKIIYFGQGRLLYKVLSGVARLKIEVNK